MTAPYYQDDTVTIYHGDCREIDAWDIAGGVMVTDPPYGRKFASNHPVTGKTSPIIGDETPESRDGILERWTPRPALVFGSWQIPRPFGVRHVLTWQKGGTLGMGDLKMPWGPCTEEVYVIGHGWVGGRRSSVLNYQTQTGRGAWKKRLQGMDHPTAKPLGLMTDLIGNCPPLAVIVDPFMGSGTTLRAAKDLGRKAIGIELDEKYCEIAAKRMAQGVLDFGAAA